jgi:hypothetical protein
MSMNTRSLPHTALRAGVALLAALWLAQAGAAEPARPASAPTAAGPRTVTWDDLVPKDWNPMKQFRETNLNALSDADPRATEMLRRLRETWDKAPTNPAVEDQAIRIPGYVVPLDESKAGMREFLLVPYLGACIHTPPPPANQIIHVKTDKPAKGLRMMDAIWLSGRIRSFRSDTAMGVSGYRMEAAGIEPYTEQKR